MIAQCPGPPARLGRRPWRFDRPGRITHLPGGPEPPGGFGKRRKAYWNQLVFMDLVLVESPAKAKTINKYLGRGYEVLASFGHVRDLPAKTGSVEPDADFRM